YSDDFALHVHQRPTRITRINRGVGLEEVLVLNVREFVHVAAPGADDALADRVGQPERTSDRHYPAPDGREVAVAHPGCGQVIAIEFQYGDICLVVTPDQHRKDRAAIMQEDADLGRLRTFYDMKIGKHIKSSGIAASDNDPRPCLLDLPRSPVLLASCCLLR